LNGATCAASSGTPGYTCTCAAGYTGSICAQSACDTNPCMNGATCAPIGPAPGYSCSCAPGFFGSTCSVWISNILDISFWKEIFAPKNTPTQYRYVCSK